MNAREHTDSMLRWWRDAGITRADLAVRRPGGAMLWHRHVMLHNLPLPWARAENVRGSEIYIRPARDCSWPLLFLDDVSLTMTHRVIRAYAALAVHTSPAGGCHLWLRLDRTLDQHERTAAQSWLSTRTAADPRSVSGEHLGRLAGFKNWKRGGTWVNVIAASTTCPAWNPTPALRALSPSQHAHATPFAPSPVVGRDTSPSGREWARVCSMLESGADPSSVLAMLISSAQPRRRSDAVRYAHHTLNRALLRTALARHPERTT